MTQSDNTAIQALIEARSRIAPNLDEALIQALYAIQQRHQYEQDRIQPRQQMDRLIDSYVDQLIGTQGEQD